MTEYVAFRMCAQVVLPPMETALKNEYVRRLANERQAFFSITALWADTLSIFTKRMVESGI